MIDNAREINTDNVIAYNESLHDKLHAISGHPELTRELMKFTIHRIIEALNKTSMTHKRLFFLKCLELC